QSLQPVLVPGNTLGSVNQGHDAKEGDVEAIKRYTKAAEQGDGDAQFYLGWIYEQGQGVDQSNVEAI
ncbi:hypothetical protein BGZ95_006468, partial [Linnemannia exigua]